MNVTIQSLHFEATEQLKEFITKKLSKLDKFTDTIVNAEVILKVVKPETSNNKEASIKLNVKNGDFFANKVANTFEEASVLCIEALEKQIFKAKEKKQDK